MFCALWYGQSKKCCGIMQWGVSAGQRITINKTHQQENRQANSKKWDRRCRRMFSDGCWDAIFWCLLLYAIICRLESGFCCASFYGGGTEDDTNDIELVTHIMRNLIPIGRVPSRGSRALVNDMEIEESAGVRIGYITIIKVSGEKRRCVCLGYRSCRPLLRSTPRWKLWYRCYE